MRVARLLGSFIGRHRFLSGWLFLTLALAGVYQTVWTYRPDYFRVQSDLNFRPIDLAVDVRRYTEASDGSLPELRRPDVQAAVSRLQSAYDTMQIASGRLAFHRRALQWKVRDAERSRLAFEASQWAQFDQYVRLRTQPFDQRISELEQTLAGILRESRVRSPNDLHEGPAAIAYAETRTQLAEQNLAQLNAQAAAHSYAISHLEQFQSTPHQTEYRRQIRALEEARRSLVVQESRLIKYASDVEEAERAYRRAAGSSLTFFDFVYFSLGGATGANFGDISPNHTFIRILYSLQIVISIGLLSLLIERLIKTTKSGD